MKFEITLDSKTVKRYKELLQILVHLKALQSVTTDDELLQNLKETFLHYQDIRDDMMIEISNDLGLQFEALCKL